MKLRYCANTRLWDAGPLERIWLDGKLVGPPLSFPGQMSLDYMIRHDYLGVYLLVSDDDGGNKADGGTNNADANLSHLLGCQPIRVDSWANGDLLPEAREVMPGELRDAREALEEAQGL